MRLLWRQCLLIAGLTVIAFSCGDDSSDPDVIKVSELLGPGKLVIVDNGDGSVTLNWNVSNAEEDFEGYNIYGGKLKAEDLSQYSATRGQSLQLLSQTGDPLENAKSLLQAMDFDEGNDKALPGAPAKKTDEDEDEEDKPKFNFFPIHKQNADQEPILPSCQPASSSDANNAPVECKLVETEDSKKDSDEVSAFGYNFYKINGLTAGESYCFLVFSVQDGGEEISQASSTIECVVPKIEADWSPITLGATGEQQAYDIATFATDCDLDNSTPCPDKDSYKSTRNDPGGIGINDNADADKYAVHFEAYGSETDAFIVGGTHVAIKDVGTYGDLNSVPNDISKVAFPAAGYSSDSKDGEKNSLVSGSYTRPFASIPLKHNHVYVIAIGNQGEGVESPTEFTYHWLHVSGTGGTVSKTSSFTPTWRLSKVAGEL